MGHLLSEIRDVTDRSFPVDQAGHRVSLALRRFDDRSPIMVGDVVKSKRNTMPRQDVPDGDAEGDQGNWMRVSMGVYATEAKPNRKRTCTRQQQRVFMENDISEIGWIIGIHRRSEFAIAY